LRCCRRAAVERTAAEHRTRFSMVVPWLCLRRPASRSVCTASTAYALSGRYASAGRECPPFTTPLDCLVLLRTSDMVRAKSGARSSGRRRLWRHRPTPQACPFLLPRSFYAMAALCVPRAASAPPLLALDHGLDLRAPSTQFLFEDQPFATRKTRPLSAKGQKGWMDEGRNLCSRSLGRVPSQLAIAERPGRSRQGYRRACESADPSGKRSQWKDREGRRFRVNRKTKARGSERIGPRRPLDNASNRAPTRTMPRSRVESREILVNPVPAKTGTPPTVESLLSRLKDSCLEHAVDRIEIVSAPPEPKRRRTSRSRRERESRKSSRRRAKAISDAKERRSGFERLKTPAGARAG